MEPDQFILINLDLATRIGKKYAYKQSKYEPECIAEAFYQLTVFAKTKLVLYNEADIPEAYLRVSIYRGISKYFSYRSEMPDTEIQYKTIAYSEFEMIDWLESHFPADPDIFRHLREGFDLDDLEHLKKINRRTIRDLNKKRKARLKQLKRVEDAGLEIQLGV